MSLLVGGLVGMAVHDDEPVHEPAVQPTPVQAEAALDTARREQAWLLTKRAAEAARAGDCSAVIALSLDVHAADAEFHASVFMRDIAIARCVSSAP